MKIVFYSIDQAPLHVPAWDVMLDDLGRPLPQRIARVLGVGRSTVYRWNLAGSAPRAACLALFWLTRWGRSQIHTQAVNDAQMAAALARGLGDELRRVERRFAHVMALAHTGEANQPFLRG